MSKKLRSNGAKLTLTSPEDIQLRPQTGLNVENNSNIQKKPEDEFVPYHDYFKDFKEFHTLTWQKQNFFEE